MPRPVRANRRENPPQVQKGIGAAQVSFDSAPPAAVAAHVARRAYAKAPRRMDPLRRPGRCRRSPRRRQLWPCPLPYRCPSQALRPPRQRGLPGATAAGWPAERPLAALELRGQSSRAARYAITKAAVRRCCANEARVVGGRINEAAIIELDLVRCASSTAPVGLRVVVRNDSPVAPHAQIALHAIADRKAQPIGATWRASLSHCRALVGCALRGLSRVKYASTQRVVESLVKLPLKRVTQLHLSVIEDGERLQPRSAPWVASGEAEREAVKAAPIRRAVWWLQLEGPFVEQLGGGWSAAVLRPWLKIEKLE
eukprot:scaffold213061_cov28-Tisochrysis_lutea.AAC.2